MNASTRLALSALALISILVACGSDEPGDEVEVASGSIGPDGGTVAGGGLTLVVPKGALAEKTTFSIKALGVPLVGFPPTFSSAGRSYAISPADVHLEKLAVIRIALDRGETAWAGRPVVLMRSESQKHTWGPAALAEITDGEIVAYADNISFDWTAMFADDCNPAPEEAEKITCNSSTCICGKHTVAVQASVQDRARDLLVRACGGTCTTNPIPADKPKTPDAPGDAPKADDNPSP